MLTVYVFTHAGCWTRRGQQVTIEGSVAQDLLWISQDAKDGTRSQEAGRELMTAEMEPDPSL